MRVYLYSIVGTPPGIRPVGYFFVPFEIFQKVLDESFGGFTVQNTVPRYETQLSGSKHSKISDFLFHTGAQKMLTFFFIY